MCRAISFFSMSSDAQFESGAIQDTRILTGSAFDAPCATSEIVTAMSPINQDRTSHIFPSHAGAARKLTIATLANKPQPRPFGSWFRHPLERLHRSEEHTSELQSLAYLVCRL